MFDAWKRGFDRKPDRGPVRWVFLVVGLLYVVQSIFFWQTMLLTRIGVLLVGLGWIALFAADSLSPRLAHRAGFARRIGLLIALTGGLLLVVDGVRWLV